MSGDLVPNSDLLEQIRNIRIRRRDELSLSEDATLLEAILELGRLNNVIEAFKVSTRVWAERCERLETNAKEASA
jgi:hypothetical protein